VTPVDADNPIYCLGDSHAGFFGGADEYQPQWPLRSKDRLSVFRSFRLGAITAYNLVEAGSSSRGREKLFEALDAAVPVGARVLLCFGEIDCRAHLVKQAHLQGRLLNVVVDDCVERYFSVVREVRERGYDVMIFGVVASTMSRHADHPEYPVYGTIEERNRATELFNQGLRLRCGEAGLPLVDVFPRLVTPTGRTRSRFYFDGIHLGQSAMPMVLREIESAMGQGVLQLPWRDRLRLKAQAIRGRWSAPRKPGRRGDRVTRRRNPRAMSAKYTAADVGFHGDEYLMRLVAHLAPQCHAFIETGSNVGSTAAYVARSCPHLAIYSCEADDTSFAIATERLAPHPQAKVFHQPSPQFLHDLFASHPDLSRHNNLYWLDAHGYGFRWPLKDEVAFLTRTLDRGMILIDDFRVPGRPEFRFDQSEDQVCAIESIAPDLDPRHDYHLVYPAYTQRTSEHHPLTGVGLIVFGDADFSLPPDLQPLFTLTRP
jgi:lysophospholipase L1-like esterase